jgi:hypothetical protein
MTGSYAGRGKTFLVKKVPITPAERMVRMQKMFDEEHAILAEDYHFFTKK